MLFLARLVLLYAIYTFKSRSASVKIQLFTPHAISIFLLLLETSPSSPVVTFFLVIKTPSHQPFVLGSSLSASKALDLVQGTDSLRPFE